MSEIGRRPSWDSDEELLGDAPTFTFENDIENEDELLGCSDNETTFDEERPTPHTTTPWPSKANSQSEESQNDSDVQQLDSSFQDGMNNQDANNSNSEITSSHCNANNEVEMSDVHETSATRHYSEGELEVSLESDDRDEDELDYEEEEEEECDDDESARERNRFTSERNSINISKSSSRAHIPDTLEISKEDEKRIEEFVHDKGQKNRRRNNQQPNRRMQPHMQRGHHNTSMGLLGHPNNMNLNLIQRFANQNYPGNLSQTLASAAINLMMDGSLHLRQRMDNPSLQSIIDQQSVPINRPNHSDHRLKAPFSFSKPPSTMANNLVISDHLNIQRDAQFLQSGVVPRPIMNPPGDVSRIQVINHEMRPPPSQIMTPQPLMQTRMMAPLNNRMAIMTHPSMVPNLQPGMFRTSVLQPPINLNVPPPQQRLPNNFMQQPIRLLVPVNQPFGGGGLAPFHGNPQQMQQQQHLHVLNSNFNNPQFSSARHEIIGQPIETVVLRQSGNKNKLNNKPNNSLPANNIPPVPKQQQQPKVKPMNQSELQEAEKLARRAARFSKPAQVAPKVTNQEKVEQERTNRVAHNHQKRVSSPEMSEDDNPAKVMRLTTNRKVIARSDTQHRNVLASENSSVSNSGDGDFKDFELMKALEKQKKLREMVLKKKEESRLLLAQSKKNGSEANFQPALSAAAPSANKPTIQKITAPSSSSSSSLPIRSTDELIAGSSQEDKNKPKTLKKVVMTKSQYKALVQHMKSKGIPLPTSVKEVKQTPKSIPSSVDNAARGTKDRRIVQLSSHEQTLLVAPPRLLPVPPLMVPEVMPLPPAIANHPRFSSSAYRGVVSDQRNSVVLDGLSPTTNYTQLRSMAEKIGPILNLQLMLTERQAKITFHNPQHAQIFINRYNGSIIEHSFVSATVSSQ